MAPRLTPFYRYFPLAECNGDGPAQMTIGIVIIGRNEGERFQNCIRSLEGVSDRVVYVDSGSTDNSVNWAKDAGFQVETLPADRPFTAARARNAGYRRLVQQFPDTVFIQFMDGDCQLDAVGSKSVWTIWKITPMSQLLLVVGGNNFLTPPSTTPCVT